VGLEPTPFDPETYVHEDGADETGKRCGTLSVLHRLVPRPVQTLNLPPPCVLQASFSRKARLRLSSLCDGAMRRALTGS
jgi:hypothetical protein